MVSILKSALTASPLTGSTLVDGLIQFDSGGAVGAYWNFQAALTGDPVVTFSFDLNGVDTSARFSAATSITEFSDPQSASARRAIAELASVTGIRTREVGDASTADIVFGLGDLDGYAGWAASSRDYTFLGDLLTACSISSSVTIDQSYASSDLGPGGYGYMVLLHEIGHVFGLKHPHEGAPIVDASIDNSAYSLMSYDVVSNDATTYTTYDRLALQTLYGSDGLMGQGIGSAYSTVTIAGIGTFGQSEWYASVVEGTTAFDQLHLDAAGVSVTVSAIETVHGGAGGDAVTLGVGGQTTTVSSIETLFGGAGADRVTLFGASTIIMAAVETLVGSSAVDLVTLGNRGSTITVSAVESLAGGIANDWVALGEGGQVLSISGIETMIGGGGADNLTLASAATITLASIETLLGSTGGDWLNLGAGGNTMSVGAVEIIIGGVGADDVSMSQAGMITLAALETLTGSSGADWLTLGNRGNTMWIGAVETIIGGVGLDAVSLSQAGTIILAALETLTGSSGADFVTLGNRGNTIRVEGLETVIGGAAADHLTLGSAATITIAAIESLTGGSGLDAALLGDRGNTVAIFDVETVSGGAAGDWVALADGGRTVSLSSVETLIGGSGNDLVTLHAASTMIVAAVETITGQSTGADALVLGARGATITLTGIDTVTGGAGNDRITLLDGALTFTGGAGADQLALLGASAADRVVFTAVADGAQASYATGSDTVTGFQAASDLVVLGGALGRALDHDGDGVLDIAYRASGQAAPVNDELIFLTTPIAGSVTADVYFGAFRTALGSLPESAVVVTSAVVAEDASGASGIYLIEDADGNGVLGALEIRLLAVFPTTPLSAANFALAQG
ncbi:MAG: hypothetical protein HQL41_05175 [Alphaproteobacteria bacterium]|nr:hypothetical protein [Alphaproteobacteria bacterium]